MTIYKYSELSNGDEIDFDPNTDVLSVDIIGLSAAGVTVSVTSDGAGVLIAGPGLSFTLKGPPVAAIGSTNVVFADESTIVNAELGNGFASTLHGGTGNDLLMGSGTPPERQLVAATTTHGAANSPSQDPALSTDGRFVAFTSNATNLVDAQSSGRPDVYLKDLVTGAVVRVSETATGAPAHDGFGFGCQGATVSADGRYVAFHSYAYNLTGNDTNNQSDVFLKDLHTGSVTRISTSSSNAQSSGSSYDPSISADGRYVAFVSTATDLVAGDTNNAPDVFVKDTVTGVVTRVSTNADGQQGNGIPQGSSDVQISADGRFVVFKSVANNLVPGDTNGVSDIFVKNLETGEVVCASVDGSGDFVSGDATTATISPDGRFVIFEGYKDLIDDGNSGGGTYLRDMQTGVLTRIPGSSARLSGDGRFAVFLGAADITEVFVRDLSTGETARIPTGPNGVEQNVSIQTPGISLDGSAITFGRLSSDFVDGDQLRSDVFVLSNPLYVRTLAGGAGNDTYQIDNTRDLVVEETGQGIDTVRASVRVELADNVENLVLTGTAAINGVGNELNNKISGNSAANTISGGLGADTMTGAGGDDTYYVDNTGDRVVESTSGGLDTVRSSVGHTLSTNVENLVLTGAVSINGNGNAGNNTLIGNAGNNALNGSAGIDTVSYSAAAAAVTVNLSTTSAQATGGAGTDTLLGFENLTGSAFADNLSGTAGANLIDGGKGADTMTGGAGDDTYVVDNAGDRIVEGVGAGIDLVQSLVTFMLQAEVDNLTLTGSANINGTGNKLANVLVGNAGNNVLTGGSGSDTYVVNNAGDQTIEQVAGGLDTVKASVSWTLANEAENLTLTGTTAINGTGNSKANVIVGNGAANLLDGGVGADTMTGGSGGDTYLVDNSGDRTIEQVAGGLDTVKSSISWTLETEVENLTMTGVGSINATGNTKNNVLVGNAAANTLNGGAGADTMTGGAGADIFDFSSTLGSDTITDFVHAGDKVRLSQSAIRVGNGDTVVEGAVSVAGPNGFSNAAELVIFTHDIAGDISATSAAAAIGKANSNYAVGDSRLFVVDNGHDTAVYLFKSIDDSATVTANELTLVTTLEGAVTTSATDFIFGA